VNQQMTLPRPATKDDVEEMAHRAALIFRMAKDLKTKLEAKRKAVVNIPPPPEPIPTPGPSSDHVRLSFNLFCLKRSRYWFFILP
jgi:hypothetical protein